MGLRLTVNVPGAGEGDPVEVPGLGVYANGGTYDISDERVSQAVGSGMQPAEVQEEGAELIAGVEGAELGPPVVDWDGGPVMDGSEEPTPEEPVGPTPVVKPPVEPIAPPAPDPGGGE